LSVVSVRLPLSFPPASTLHGKLPNARAAARMKAYWKDALTRLHSILQT
jgi:hypothetical protein